MSNKSDFIPLVALGVNAQLHVTDTGIQKYKTIFCDIMLNDSYLDRSLNTQLQCLNTSTHYL